MLSIRVAVFFASALLMFTFTPGAAADPVQAATASEVRFVYLVPSDRAASIIYPGRIAFAARHFQSWLAEKLGGNSFQLSNPIVRTVRSDKPARWFSSTERYIGYDAFYRNALDELGRLNAAKVNHPQVRYIVYVDADHACGQSGAGGNGVAVVSANDLRGLSGETIVPACDKANGAEIPGRCRWIGGMGHELLHTLGLIHPDRSAACQTVECRSKALMVHGYVTYPKALLLDEEKFALGRSPFVRPQSKERLVECESP